MQLLAMFHVLVDAAVQKILTNHTFDFEVAVAKIAAHFKFALLQRSFVAFRFCSLEPCSGRPGACDHGLEWKSDCLSLRFRGGRL